MQIKQNIIIYTRTATVHCIRRFCWCRLNFEPVLLSLYCLYVVLTIPTFRVNQLVKAIVDHEDTGPDAHDGGGHFPGPVGTPGHIRA